ncbi:cysteine hydrolase [Stenotrophomonas indicatrix]|uniref:hypothetical protein n=1 Tax=Stenotrophomonas indicatrix TaxID=2045451 RepID=UPI00300AF620
MNDNFGNWQRDFPQLVEAYRRKGGASGQIVEYLAPSEEHYFILKPKHSAFLATPLPALLANATVVAREAVATLPDRRRPSLQSLQGSGAVEVLSNRQIIASLPSTSSYQRTGLAPPR